MTVASRVAVMNHGKILQVGAPMELYLRPTERFVAQFIGSSNNLRGQVTDSGKLLIEGYPVQAKVPEILRNQNNCLVCMRPEHINLNHTGNEADGIPGKLAALSFLGQTVRAKVVMADGTELQVDVQTSDWLTKGLKVGDEVSWTPHPGSAMVFSADDHIEKEAV